MAVAEFLVLFYIVYFEAFELIAKIIDDVEKIVFSKTLKYQKMNCAIVYVTK